MVRFINVGAQISSMGTGIDHINATVCNQTNCNVRLGSMNAAMVVENSFWLWFEHSSFVAQANSGNCPKPYKQVRALSSTNVAIVYKMTCLN